MFQIERAKGAHLDMLGDMQYIQRKKLKSIPLVFGWKIVKEESDDDYRKRIYKIITGGRR